MPRSSVCPQRRQEPDAAGRKALPEGRIHVRSAGSDPGEEINPAVVTAMEEIGIDMGEEYLEASRTRLCALPTS